MHTRAFCFSALIVSCGSSFTSGHDGHVVVTSGPDATPDAAGVFGDGAAGSPGLLVDGASPGEASSQDGASGAIGADSAAPDGGGTAGAGGIGSGGSAGSAGAAMVDATLPPACDPPIVSVADLPGSFVWEHGFRRQTGSATGTTCDICIGTPCATCSQMTWTVTQIGTIVTATLGGGECGYLTIGTGPCGAEQLCGTWRAWLHGLDITLTLESTVSGFRVKSATVPPEVSATPTGVLGACDVDLLRYWTTAAAPSLAADLKAALEKLTWACP